MIRILLAYDPMEGLGKKEQQERLSLLGKELLALGAKRYYHLSWETEEEKKRELEVRKEINGKPVFVRYPGIHFNISHSGNYAACGFSDKPLGMDLQKRVEAPFMKIAKRYFSQKDQEWICRQKDVKKAFYKIWTAEESYAKWQGSGLSRMLGSEEKKGHVLWFEPTPGYQGAVYSEKKEWLLVERVERSFDIVRKKQ